MILGYDTGIYLVKVSMSRKTEMNGNWWREHRDWSWKKGSGIDISVWVWSRVTLRVLWGPNSSAERAPSPTLGPTSHLGINHNGQCSTDKCHVLLNSPVGCLPSGISPAFVPGVDWVRREVLCCSHRAPTRATTMQSSLLETPPSKRQPGRGQLWSELRNKVTGAKSSCSEFALIFRY